MRVLLVDDDLMFLKVMCDTLKAVTFKTEVEVCSSFGEALIKLHESKSFDLIILDYNLQGSPIGFRLWEECKARFPETPILVTSGIDTEDFMRVAKRFNSYPVFLPKPFSVRDLRGVIHSIVSERRAS